MGRAQVLIVEDLSQQRLAARQLAAVLDRAGIAARLADLSDGEAIATIVRQAQVMQPALVMGSLLFADRSQELLALMTALQRAGVAAHRTLIGHLPSLAPDEFLDACPALDSVLVGEAEVGAIALARAAQEGSKTDQVPGLMTQARRRTVEQARIADLNDLPFPYYESVPARLGYGFATVRASRGCYHDCAFCLPNAFYRKRGQPRRQRAVAQMVDEIEALYARGVRLFLFDDEQFLPPPRSAQFARNRKEDGFPTGDAAPIAPSLREDFMSEFSAELTRRRLRIGFTIKCRGDDVEPALFNKLVGCGLLRVYVGIESGSSATLQRLRKGTTPERNAEALRVLSDMDLVADWGLLLFHPWSTLESVEQELEFLADMLPWMRTAFTFHEVAIYAGTSLAGRLGSTAENRGPGQWVLTYTSADCRVELARRLYRLIFGPTARYSLLTERLTQAWFDLLLEKRFSRGWRDGDRARELSHAAHAANAAAIEIGNEIMAFLRHRDPFDVCGVNDQAASWAIRVAERANSILSRIAEPGSG